VVIDMTLSTRRLIVGVAAILITVAAVAVWTGMSTKPASAQPAAAKSSSSSKVLKLEGTPNDQYGLLRTVATPDDDVSTWGVHPIPVVSPQFAGARVVLRSATRSIAAVPAKFGPCLVARIANGSRGMACGTNRDEHPAMVGYEASIGLVPDSVESVTYAMADGSDQTARVVGNMWKAPPAAVTVSYTDGKRSFRVELMPTGSLPADAELDPNTGLVGPKSSR
jgi:hypothetical protein